MESLPSAALYDKFAYRVALLKFFATDIPAGLAADQVRLKQFGSVVVGGSGDEAASSVHGSSVFATFRKDKKADGSLRRATSSDGLSRMNGGVTISF